MRNDDSRVRLAELVAALSLATDLGMGQPLEQALRSCHLATSAGRAMGLAADDLRDVYFLSLLRFIGCTADATEQSALTDGDEIAYYAGIAPYVMGDSAEYLTYLATQFASDAPPPRRVRLVARMLAHGARGAKQSIAIHCEVARMLAPRIGLPPTFSTCLEHLFERWDGKGLPGDVAGESILVPARFAAAARDVDIFARRGGWAMAADALKRRRGTAYDPEVVDMFLEQGERWLVELAGLSAWESVLDIEPRPWAAIGETRLDEALLACADFADLKSVYTRGHSRAVATLAAGAGRQAGLPEREATSLRRAGLVHDLGRVGIPNGIWDKPGPLSRAEWERVRLHPYLSERVLSHAGALASLAPLAGSHHERLDGSGYHRGSRGAQLPPETRILAAADVYQAMTQDRPYRPALTPAEAARQLIREGDEGRLDGDAIRCVLATAGYHYPRRHQGPSGLSEREIDVLRLIARGASYKDVASRLSISPKTAEHHVAHIYAKIGVSSRAAAALFAMEHNLL